MIGDMTFGEAMVQAAKGEKVRRRGWFSRPPHAGDEEFCFELRDGSLRQPSGLAVIDAADICAMDWEVARPRRSRVQEMAKTESINYPMDVPLIQQTEARYRRAIHVVCQYVRERKFDGRDDIDGDDIALSIESEFLEPR